MEKFNLYITYEENSRGGEICEGGEDDSFPDHEPTYREYKWLTARKENIDDKYGSLYQETVEIDFDPAKRKYVYLIVVVYTTGDTFGHTCGENYLEGAYKTRKESEKIKKEIDDCTYKKYSPWSGYFEALEEVKIIKLEIGQ